MSSAKDESHELLTDWPTPVGVPTKHPRHGITRPVVDFVALAMDIDAPRLFLMFLRKASGRYNAHAIITGTTSGMDLRSNAVLAEELVFVKHLFQHAL